MSVANENVKSVLEKKFDPSGYQWMQYGKVLKIDTLSREDLLQIACECMTVLERMESLHMDMAELSNKWHKGEIQPDKAEDWVDQNVVGPASLVLAMKIHSGG